MKIVHVINSMSSTYGGPAYTTLLAVRGMNRLGVHAQIVTKQMFPGEYPVSDDSFISYLPTPRFYYSRWGYAGSFRDALSVIPSVDVFHIQELWQYPGYAAAKCATKRGCPYVVTLHGSMYPEAMGHSAQIKKMALRLFERRLLQQAACVHVTCLDEMKHYRSLGFTNPVAVISNPLEICRVENPAFTEDKKRVGYLGRLHPRKRVERLLEVWSRLHEPGELLIIGDGEPDYVSFLRNEVKRLQLSDVRFIGWVSGEEKNCLLASLTCLVVPSDFENFGMIVPEALLQEVPVIASTGAPWQELETYGCGWWVNNDTDTLMDTVRNVLTLDAEVLCEMGRRGRQLVLEKYALDIISQQMAEMYEWAVGRINKPDFIFE